MNRIVIVEDDLSISKYLITIVKEINPEVEIFTTGYSEEAMTYLQNVKVDAFFLDIQLKDYSGIELAKKIRLLKKYEFSPIIFITGLATKELEAFREIHCYEYIVKPFDEEKVKAVFKKILVDYFGYADEEQTPKIFLEFKGFTQILECDEILYVEYRNRKVHLMTKNEEIVYKHVPLKNFIELLPDWFFRVHQAIIVNKQYIHKVDVKASVIELCEGTIKVPIGRSYHKKIQEMLHEFF